MFVIRLPNGNLQVPQTATGNDGRVIANAYVEIGPQDAEYARLLKHALTPAEVEERKNSWRAGDEALRQEFLEFARANGEYDWTEAGDERELGHCCQAAHFTEIIGTPRWTSGSGMAFW